MSRFSCPTCKTVLEASAEHGGKTISCPKCKAKMKLPAAPKPAAVPVTDQWHYAQKGQQQGPITFQQLKQLAGTGAIQPVDFVWTAGMSAWTPAGQVAGLFAGAGPPPLPAVLQSPDGVQIAAAHLAEAERLSDKCEFRAAIAEFTEAIRLDPHLWKAFHGRGEAHYLLDEEEEALADYTQALHLNPRSSDSFQGRAACFITLTNYQQALADASNAIALNPMDQSAYYWRGLAHRGLGDPDKAIKDFSRSIEIAPEQFAVWCQRGVAYWSKDDNTRAIADFTKALELKPDDDWSAFCRGRAYFDMNRFQEAIPDLERGLRLSSAHHVEEATQLLAKARQYVRKPSAPPKAEAPRTPSAGGGGILGGIWNWVTRKDKCPNCGSRNTKRLATTLLERWQEVRSDYSNADLERRHVPQAVFNIMLYHAHSQCACGHEWEHQYAESRRA